MAPGHEAATVRSVQLVVLGPRIALAVAVLSDGAVEKETLELDLDSTDDRVAAASAQLAAHLTGQPLADAPDVPSTGDDVTDRVVTRARRALVEAGRDEPEHVFVGGASRMAATFEAIHTVREVLSILEQQYVVVSVLQDALRHDKLVSIGAEHGVAPLAECSVVVAPYEGGGSGATIGVLGPTRMDYAQAMAAVAVVASGSPPSPGCMADTRRAAGVSSAPPTTRSAAYRNWPGSCTTDTTATRRRDASEVPLAYGTLRDPSAAAATHFRARRGAGSGTAAPVRGRGGFDAGDVFGAAGRPLRTFSA